MLFLSTNFPMVALSLSVSTPRKDGSIMNDFEREVSGFAPLLPILWMVVIWLSGLRTLSLIALRLSFLKVFCFSSSAAWLSARKGASCMLPERVSGLMTVTSVTTPFSTRETPVTRFAFLEMGPFPGPFLVTVSVPDKVVLVAKSS